MFLNGRKKAKTLITIVKIKKRLLKNKYFSFVWNYVLKIRKKIFNKPGYKKIKAQEIFFSKRKNIDTFIAHLEKYDIISFDIFDTLVFRPFEKPTDAFSLFGIKNELPWFAQYRK